MDHPKQKFAAQLKQFPADFDLRAEYALDLCRFRDWDKAALQGNSLQFEDRIENGLANAQECEAWVGSVDKTFAKVS